MLAERLQKRCPSARVRGVATAANWIMNFSKKSRHGCGMATIEPHPEGQLFGVVFDLDERERPKLDKAEGLGYGYDRDDSFLVEMDGSESLRAFTYIADAAHTDAALRPYDWYLNLVLAGAQQNSLPDDYISKIEAARPIPDPQLDRPQRLEALALLKRS